jgi:membrane associated rhomboid family serine protease
MIPIRTSVEVHEIPGVVIGLIVANVAVFIYQIGLPGDLAKLFILHNGLLPARYTDPDVAHALGFARFNVLPFLTSIFLHGDWLHLGVNMWTLWLFGRAIEERLGAPRFVLFYLACGLIAGLAHFAFNLDSGAPVLGASGAIAGVLGAYTVIHPKARIAILTPILFFPVVFHLPAVVYMGLWFAFQVAPAITEFSAHGGAAGGIAWWAHIGGFVAGLALIGVFSKQKHRVREIGGIRPGIREIGAPRPRIIDLNVRMRRRPLSAAALGLTQKLRSRAADARTRRASPGQDEPVSRPAKKGRSVIPQSGS